MRVPLLVAAGAVCILLAVWFLAGRKAEAPPRPTVETAAAPAEPAAPAATEHVELGATDAPDRATAVPATETKPVRGVLEVAFKDLANGDVRPKSGRLSLHRE
jgi:hypothetical protein